MKGIDEETENDHEEKQGLLEQWSETMYPDFCLETDANRLFDKGGSILVKRRFEGDETLNHLKVILILKFLEYSKIRASFLSASQNVCFLGLFMDGLIYFLG